MREEIDNMIRQRMERSLNARGLVTREEFDALRTRHEAAAARLAALEAKMPTKARSARNHTSAAQDSKSRNVTYQKSHKITRLAGLGESAGISQKPQIDVVFSVLGTKYCVEFG